MPLIVCPDCKKEISDAASNCPGCGRPMHSSSGTVQTQRKGGKYEAIGGILIIGGFFACFGSVVIGALIIMTGLIIFIIDGLVKSQTRLRIVIPAEAGIQ